MRWILTDRRKRVTSGWREEAEASPEAGGEEGDGDRETWRERDRHSDGQADRWAVRRNEGRQAGQPSKMLTEFSFFELSCLYL